MLTISSMFKAERVRPAAEVRSSAELAVSIERDITRIDLSFSICQPRRSPCVINRLPKIWPCIVVSELNSATATDLVRRAFARPRFEVESNVANRTSPHSRDA